MTNATNVALRVVTPTQATPKKKIHRYSRYSYATIRKDLRGDATYLRHMAMANLFATLFGCVLLCMVGGNLRNIVDALGYNPAGDTAFWTSCLLCGFFAMFIIWNIGFAVTLFGTAKEIRKSADRLSWEGK